MVFPIGDDNSDRRLTPVVNYVLIAMNVLVFVVFQGLGENDKFTYAYSTVPAEIKTGKDVVTDVRVIVDPVSGRQFQAPGLQPTPISVYVTLLTSMFMHGGIPHLLGNMWFLWIFGDNVEDSMATGWWPVPLMNSSATGLPFAGSPMPSRAAMIDIAMTTQRGAILRPIDENILGSRTMPTILTDGSGEGGHFAGSASAGLTGRATS